MMNVAFSHSVSPSALNGQGRVKELIDAIPPEEREKALKLLLAAQRMGKVCVGNGRSVPGT